MNSMNFSIPRNNNSEMLLYIWQIVDLPNISINDLLYKISFDLFLLTPEKAKDFINKCIENEYLVKDAKKNLKLSKALDQKLKIWQKKRKKEILEKIDSAKKIVQIKKDIDKKKPTKFTTLIRTFLDKGALNRAAAVSNASFDLVEFDSTKGIIKTNVAGSKEKPYVIEIDTEKKVLRHDCHDFVTRRAEDKKFCKHLVKLFLLLKEKNEISTEYFLRELTEEIDKWEFVS